MTNLPAGADVVLVVPCYNEAARLDTAAIKRFLGEFPRVALLFVDDGSRDETYALISALAQEHDRCAAYQLPQNRGKAEAVRAGVLHALEGGPRYIGYWDADLATPLEAIDDFLKVLDVHGHVSLVLGSRVQLLGRAIVRHTSRHYIGRVFATAVSIMLGLRVYDTQCGAKLFRADPQLQALFGEPFITRWLFDVELLARMIVQSGRDRARAAGAMYEMPLREWRDVHGSKVRWHDGIRAFADIARVWLRYLAPGRTGALTAQATGSTRAA